MNILFVVPYIPNLIRTRPYNLIRALSQRGHHITLATLWTSQQEHESLDEINKYCKTIYAFPLPAWKSLINCLSVLPSNQPLQSAYCWQGSMAEKIIATLDVAEDNGTIDVIHVEHLRGVRYGLYVQEKKQGKHQKNSKYPPIVWDSVDNISHLFRQSSKKSKRMAYRWLTQLELSRTESYEGWLLSRFPRTLVTSENDKQAFLRLLPANQPERDSITVLSNGVDLDYFEPGPDTNRKGNTLVVSGKMSYHANVSMVSFLVQEIMPIVWKQRADTELWIVGKDPTSEITALGNHPNITVTGTVDDIRPYLQKAAIAVSPLTYGAGVQNKVLESMACATPVVASKLAVSSLAASNGREVVVAEGPEDYARKIVELLDDQQMQRRVGHAGRYYVEKNHSWTSIAEKLEGVYYAIIKDEN